MVIGVCVGFEKSLIVSYIEQLILIIFQRGPWHKNIE